MRRGDDFDLRLEEFARNPAVGRYFRGRREASATIAEPETTELATAVGRQLMAKIFPFLLIGRMIHTARQERPHD
jgi:hypothetical protein